MIFRNKLFILSLLLFITFSALTLLSVEDPLLSATQSEGNAKKGAITSPLTFQNMFFSSLSSGTLGEGFGSQYIGSASLQINPALKTSITYGFNLANYNSVTGMSYGEKDALTLLKGVSLTYQTRSFGKLTLQYGESSADIQNKNMRGFASLFADDAADTRLSSQNYFNKSDSLGLTYEKKIGNHIEIKTVLQTSALGLREEGLRSK